MSAQVRAATAAMPPPAPPNTGSPAGAEVSNPRAPCTAAADAITLQRWTLFGATTYDFWFLELHRFVT